MDLIDGAVLLEVARVLSVGAEKYGENNWRKIPRNEHLNHLLVHAYAALEGDEQDEHLLHLVCRAIFALAVDMKGVSVGD
jgi:hypothetical protein